MNRSSSASVESEIVAACPKSVPKASWPEKSTASGDLLGRFGEGDRETADGEPGRDREQERVAGRPARFAQRASSMIAKTTTAVATASRIVQPKSPQPGPPNGGSGNGLNGQAAVLKPENEPSPMKTSEPTPAARRPGRSTSGSMGPPRPAASITSTAPITGEPKIDETAAKLPAAAISPTACSGASRLTRRIASVPSPSPSASKRAFRSRARARARASRAPRAGRPAGRSDESAGRPP